MDKIVLFVAVFMIICIALMAGIRYRRVNVRQAAIVVLILSFIGYGFTEYSMGTNDFGIIICLSSMLFATIGLPMLLIMFALDKWVSRKK